MTTDNERFAELRSLLETQNPDAETWQQVSHLILAWNDLDHLRDVVIPYANAHMGGWDDETRVLEKKEERALAHAIRTNTPPHPFYLLARSIVCYQEKQTSHSLTVVCSDDFAHMPHLSFIVDNLDKQEFFRILQEAPLTQLRELSLTWCHLDDDCIAQLAQTETLRSLELLELNGNPITSKAVKALCSSPHLPSLRRLHLGSTKIDDDALYALRDSQTLTHLTELSIESCRDLTSEGLAALAQSKAFSTLEQLHINSTIGMDDSIAPLFDNASAPRLKILHANFSYVDDDTVQKLSQWPGSETLETLEIGYNKLSDKGCHELASTPYLRHLKRLDFSNCQHATEHGIGALLRAPWAQHLEELRLWDTGITTQNIGPLFSGASLPNLRQLSLWQSQIGDKGLQEFVTHSELPSLRDLNLNDCQLTTKSLTILRKASWASTIGTLDLSNNRMDTESFGILLNSNHFPKLETLHLADNNITLENFHPTPSNTPSPIRYLNLRNNQIGGTQLFLFLDFLLECTAIQQMRFDTCQGITPDIALGLLRHPLMQQLTSLDLSSCQLGESFAEGLLDLDKPHNTFELTIDKNHFTDSHTIEAIEEKWDISID